MTACPACGYEFGSLDRPQILGALTSLAAEQRQLLESVDCRLLRARPRPGIWSALEYGCHVRDVLMFQRARRRGLDEVGWRRTGVYPWPTREVRTVEWIGQRTVHELAHHLFDCRRLLAAVPD